MPALINSPRVVFGDGWADIASFEAGDAPLIVTARIGTQDDVSDFSTAELRFLQSGAVIGNVVSVAGAVASTGEIALGTVPGRVTVQLRTIATRGVGICEELIVANEAAALASSGSPNGVGELRRLNNYAAADFNLNDKHPATPELPLVLKWVVAQQDDGTKVWRPVIGVD